MHLRARGRACVRAYVLACVCVRACMLVSGVRVCVRARVGGRIGPTGMFVLMVVYVHVCECVYA